MDHVIVAGAGLAGLRAVERLRARGYEGKLTLVGAEPRPPYDRPPLSKAVLTGESDETGLPADWRALRCELRLGTRAEALRPYDDRRGGVLETSAGPLPYDGLVIATGAAPLRLPGTGSQHVLRTLDDALRLRDRLVPGAAVVIVGAGWIGAEVASVAVGLGCRVTVLEAAGSPLAAALSPELGALTTGWYSGIQLRCGTRVVSVEPGGLLLEGGEFLPADVVLSGIGVRPDTGWLAGSGLGLAADGGVLVDGSLRTGRPDVVAVGDCAAWWSRRYGLRLRAEHWDTALNAPDVAAAALLGQDASYDPVPYVWSEQFGRMVQYAGHHTAEDRAVFRGSPADPGWTVLWLRGDRLRALLTVDRPRDMTQGRRLIARETPLDPDLITDPTAALNKAAAREPVS